MKNRITNGMLLVCLSAGFLLQSCQKEAPPAIENPTEQIQGPAEDLSDMPDNELPYSDGNENALTISTTTVGTRKNLIFNMTNEASNSLTSRSNNSTSLWASFQKYGTYSQSRVTNVARTGAYSTRFELRRTDGKIGSGMRTETCRYSLGEALGKVERWYGASYYLPSDYATDVAPEILTQWHTSIGSPPLALYTQNGTWRIVRKGNLQTNLGTYTKNKWTDFVYHVIWSTGSDGLVEVWKDGVKVYTFKGATMYAGTTAGAYMRTGIYKWPWNGGKQTYASTTSQRVVYIDDVRIGSQNATYADVAPGNY